jgi:hypothetical protein
MVGVITGVSVGAGIAVGGESVGREVTVGMGVQVAGKTLSAVGVRVGNLAAVGIGGGGKGLKLEFGSTKIVAKNPTKQQVERRTITVRKFNIRLNILLPVCVGSM